MSRSRRKTPITGITTAKTEKEDKRAANRSNRRVNNQILKSGGEESNLKPIRQTSDVWLMDKDGKDRFDPKNHPDLMRK